MSTQVDGSMLEAAANRLLEDPEAVNLLDRLRFLGYAPMAVGRAMDKRARRWPGLDIGPEPTDPAAVDHPPPLDKPAIYSVRQAIAETDLPADTSISDAIRELWGRVELAKAGIALGIDVTEQLQAKLDKAEASPRTGQRALERELAETRSLLVSVQGHRRDELAELRLAKARIVSLEAVIAWARAELAKARELASPPADAITADSPEPTAHRTHQDVVDALRDRIAREAGRNNDDDLTGLAALVTAYTGTDPRESTEMADRVQFAVQVCEQPEGLGRAVLEAVGRP